MVIRVALASLLLASTGPAQEVPQDSSWRDHDRAGRAARDRGDWRAAVRHYEILDSAIYGSPRVTLAIARAHLTLGDTIRAIGVLNRFSLMGLTHDVSADEQLRGIAAAPAFALVQRRLMANGLLRTPIQIDATMSSDEFLAEGVAYDARRRRMLVSSIRLGTIVSVSSGTAPRDFIDLKKEGGWAALGMAVDSTRDRLWVTSMWMPHTLGVSAADTGKSAVFLFDLASGKRVARYDLARGNHEPGDICVGANGDLFVSDGRAGVMYMLAPGSDTLSVLVPAGQFVSPQGCAVDLNSGAARLLVADYALGIASVDVSTGRVTWLPRSRAVAVSGIDGMVLTGEQLIAAQNGVEPNRIVAIHLRADHQAIDSVTVVAQDADLIREPTHLTMVGRDVLFVANGGFGAFDAAGKRNPAARLRAPALGRVRSVSPMLRGSEGSSTRTHLQMEVVARAGLGSGACRWAPRVGVGLRRNARRLALERIDNRLFCLICTDQLFDARGDASMGQLGSNPPHSQNPRPRIFQLPVFSPAACVERRRKATTATYATSPVPTNAARITVRARPNAHS